MNPSPSGDIRDNAEGFGSLDCDILIVDGPGDTTVRPLRPVLLKAALAERERLAKLGFNPDGTPIHPPGMNESR